MPDLSLSNELISREEGLHCNFACLLYSKLIYRLPAARVTNISSSAVNIKMKFVVDALPVDLIRMNLSMMCDYIKFCADRLLIALGYQRHYKIGNPFEWMEMISLQGKTNFFEKRVGEYSKSGVGVDIDDQTFALDVSFRPSLPTHLYFISPKSTCYTILCSQLEHQMSPSSSQLLLPWLYKKQHTQV